MKTTRIPHRIAAALTCALAFTTTGTQGEELDTRIGKLSFENGYPSKDTATKLYDEMDFQRATQAYLWSFPAVSNASIQASVFRDLGATYNDIVVFDNFLDTKSVFLTGNTTTIYALALIDLAKDGPVVLEVPPGPTAGMVSSDLKTNADGSVDLYFGPEAPKGLENNWVDTRLSKGFFVWFRSYSPTEAFFDKSWSLPDIEKVQ